MDPRGGEEGGGGGGGGGFDLGEESPLTCRIIVFVNHGSKGILAVANYCYCL